MRAGDLLLVDEISLAEDAVLERLNSVLDPTRTLVLPERGSTLEEVKAAPSFRLLATMNPGGDFGKRELSPALRNRFTEVWVPAVRARAELIELLSERLAPALAAAAAADGDGDDDDREVAITVGGGAWESPAEAAAAMLDFVDWLGAAGGSSGPSLRDLLAWLSLIHI